MAVAAFDSKEFPRSKMIQSGGELRKVTFFYTPLGAGVFIPDHERFKEQFVKSTEELAEDFKLPYRKKLYSSAELKQILGPRKATPFCDKLIQSAGDSISTVFISYVVRPPATFPYTEVGGYKCPRREVKTELFLRQLGPHFSYITAWSYFGIPRPASEIHIDGFDGCKLTSAWDDLAPRGPRVFPHGDECNPYICSADMMAFLTDVKLYQSKLKLLPDNVKAVWAEYPFQVEVRYLDVGTVSKYAWYADQCIETAEHLARPMAFLLVDELATVVPESVATEEKFREMITTMQPYFDLADYALLRGAAFQKFSSLQDTKKVKDGDTLVYIGPKSKATAEAISHMVEVEVLSAKELRTKVKEATQH